MEKGIHGEQFKGIRWFGPRDGKEGGQRETLRPDRAVEGGERLLKKKLQQDRSVMERRQLIRKTTGAMSIRKQCDVLQVNRSSLYYRPLGESPENLKIMELMDRHATTFPAEGVLSMVNMLAGKGYMVNHKRVRRLLRKMGHRTLYPKKYLSQLGLAEYKRPYLLRNLDINRANQVWSIDITYIPMKKGFMYCTGIIDVYSRKIVGWGISNSLEARHCVDVFEDAVRKYGKPEIINSDQGTQFTSHKWTSAVENRSIKVSMDGKGRATDNRWIERFWRTLKHQYIYLNPANDGLELFENIKFYIGYYNSEKVHQTINETPNRIYKQSIQKQQRILTNDQAVFGLNNGEYYSYIDYFNLYFFSIYR